MKIAWAVLGIRATTDFLIAAGGAYTSAVVAFPEQKFNKEQVVLFFVLGLVAAARTVQHALETTPEGSAGPVALTGSTTVAQRTVTDTATTKTEPALPKNNTP